MADEKQRGHSNSSTANLESNKQQQQQAAKTEAATTEAATAAATTATAVRLEIKKLKQQAPTTATRD